MLEKKEVVPENIYQFYHQLKMDWSKKRGLKRLISEAIHISENSLVHRMSQKHRVGFREIEIEVLIPIFKEKFGIEVDDDFFTGHKTK